MADNRLNLQALIEDFQGEAAAVFPLFCATASPLVVGPHVDRLTSLRDDFRAAKRAVHGTGQEALANALLGFQSIAEALVQEAKMWISLSEGRAHDAWRHVVDAEEHAALALRTPITGSLRDEMRGRHHQLQTILFPPMMFMSAGYEHDEGKCTICDQLHSTCPHIQGRIYDGQVCAEYDRQTFNADHVAMVEVPMDKHCYLASFKPEGGDWIDKLTGDSTPKRDGDDDSAFLSQGTIMSTKLPAGSQM